MLHAYAVRCGRVDVHRFHTASIFSAQRMVPVSRNVNIFEFEHVLLFWRSAVITGNKIDHTKLEALPEGPDQACLKYH